MKPALALLTCLPPLLGLALGACSREPTPDERFAALAGRYLEARLALDPEWATNQGDHRHDGRLTDWSAEGIAARVALHRGCLDSLDGLQPELLSAGNRIDLAILRDELEYSLFRLEDLREHAWNPLVYTVGEPLHDLLARTHAPLEDRLRDLVSRLDDLPARLAAARANLSHPPRVHVETAIEQNRGAVLLLREDLPRAAADAPQLGDEVTAAGERAVELLQEYGRWLEGDLLPRADGDFRLGEDLYRRKLHFELGSDLTPEQIADSARRDLAATRQEIHRVALPLHRRFFPDVDPQTLPPSRVVREVLDRLAREHPDNGTIVEEARHCLQEATAFVREHDLVGVPDETIRLIVMPEFQRGVAVAYCDAPGPLETGGETFYSIAPTPRDWSPERVESFFREYNDHMLMELTIHEAMPGHYLQLAHANRYEAPTPVRAVFASGTFIEGWATYAEQIMAEAGFGGAELRMQQLKMRLRLILNALLDQGVHMGDLDREEAMRLMQEEAYQEEGEAAGKWRRAQLTSAQLSTYYVGNLEVNAIRRGWERQEGAGFDRRAFHDLLLSQGSPPPRHARRLLGL